MWFWFLVVVCLTFADYSASYMVLYHHVRMSKSDCHEIKTLVTNKECKMKAVTPEITLSSFLVSL